jgi:hypothetical protein
VLLSLQVGVCIVGGCLPSRSPKFKPSRDVRDLTEGAACSHRLSLEPSESSHLSQLWLSFCPVQVLVKPLRLGTVSVCMLQALGIAMSRMRAAAADSAAGALKTWLKGKRVMVVDDTLINRWALGHPG